MMTPVPTDCPPSTSALIVTTDGAMCSMTAAISSGEVIGPRGSDTLIGSSLALLGGESIQSETRLPTSAPVSPAVHATTATRTTNSAPRRRGRRALGRDRRRWQLSGSAGGAQTPRTRRGQRRHTHPVYRVPPDRAGRGRVHTRLTTAQSAASGTTVPSPGRFQDAVSPRAFRLTSASSRPLAAGFHISSSTLPNPRLACSPWR